MEFINAPITFDGIELRKHVQTTTGLTSIGRDLMLDGDTVRVCYNSTAYSPSEVTAIASAVASYVHPGSISRSLADMATYGPQPSPIV